MPRAWYYYYYCYGSFSKSQLIILCAMLLFQLPRWRRHINTPLRSPAREAANGHVQEWYPCATSIRAHPPPTYHIAQYCTDAPMTQDAVGQTHWPACPKRLTESSCTFTWVYIYLCAFFIKIKLVPIYTCVFEKIQGEMVMDRAELYFEFHI